ncbi:MAG: TGS domain-containing protein, partial [Eubacteriales bacterium]|nr:TGS domain-containing protein [Eubacteriales bacterium]
MINITLKDGSIKQYEEGTTILEVAMSISQGLAKVVLAGSVDGEVKDLMHKLKKDCEVNLLKFEDEGGAKAYRHTASHVMAQAVKRLYPKAKLAIGPSIEDGFYYDFDVDKTFSADDFEKIEKEMDDIIKADLPVERFVLPRAEAVKFMEDRQEAYKVELIKELPENEDISFYRQGDFVDLCAGPH